MIELVVTGMVAVLLVLGAIAAASLNSFYAELPAYQARLQGHVEELRSFFAGKGIRGMEAVLLTIANPDKALSLTPSLFAKLGSRFYVDIERYVVIKTLVSLVTGILIGAWLFVLGVDFPVLWGFLAFLLNFVPSVGSTIAAVPAVLLALVQLGVGPALMATAGFMTVNFVLDNLIETRLMGQKLGLPASKK